MGDENPTFLELLDWHDEFVFIYNGIKYEIVNGDEKGEGSGVSLYLSDDLHGTFLQSYLSQEDFLKHATIGGKPVSQILDDIELP